MPRKQKNFSIEHQDFDEYAKQLFSLREEALPRTSRIIRRGALNIKKGAQRRVPQSHTLPYYARSISYDSGEEGLTAWAEIGPDKRRRQGPLGNLIEYGSPTSPPHPHMGPAGDEEEPKFAEQLQKLAYQLGGGR